MRSDSDHRVCNIARAVAADGAAGQNGPYARALAAQVRAAQGTRIEHVFIAVRKQVIEETRSRQAPWANEEELRPF
jgi:predicted N-formylglutamate amidohydrolase